MATNEFVSRMDSLQNTIIIFAGYKKEMKEFFEKNPGLASRIQKVVTFDDYSTEELAEISKRIAKDRGFDISEDAINTKLIPIFKEAKSCASTTFGNGRFCRNLVEDAIARKANNINFETVFRESDEELFTLEANCFKMPELLLKTEKTSKIGF